MHPPNRVVLMAIPGVLIGLLLFDILYLVGVNGSRPERQASAENEHRTGIVQHQNPDARLLFEEPSFNAGVFWRGAANLVVHHEYHFVNRTTSPVRITKHVVGCLCIGVTYDADPIPPGAEGKLRTSIDLRGYNGPFRAGALVFLDNDDSQRIELYYQCYIVDRPVVIPQNLEFGDIVAGRSARRLLTVRAPLSPKEQHAGAAIDPLSHPDFSADVMRCETRECRSQELSYLQTVTETEFGITLKPTKQPGDEIDNDIRLKLTGRAESLKVKLHARIVHPAFVLEPAVINLGPITSRGVRRKIVIRSNDSAPPPVESIARPDTASGLRAWLEKNPENEKEKFLWVEAKPDATAFLEGKITLNVKDKDFPRYSIPYTGYLAK